MCGGSSYATAVMLTLAPTLQRFPFIAFAICANTFYF